MLNAAEGSTCQIPNTSHQASLGEVLRQARAEASLSYEALAARAQTSQAYLHRLEKGEAANPGRNLLIRLGIVLFGGNIDEIDELLRAAKHVPLRTDR
jgi:transcriptional regulator with XRE-family HTH domain